MSRPPDSRRQVASELHAAAIHLLRRVREVDRALPVGPARASALSVLVFGGPRTLGELAAAEQVTAPTMSRMVSGLVRMGLVRRERDPADRRRLRLAASPRAVRVLRAGRARRLAWLDALLAPLEAGEQVRLGEAARVVERLLRASRQIPQRQASASAGARRRR